MNATEIAAALSKNSHTEAEPLGEKTISLIVRPQGSSRTFRVQAQILAVEEI